MTKWLVTGGAGYVGSAVVTDLISAGKEVLVVDNFSSGLRNNLKDVPLDNVLDTEIHKLPVLSPKALKGVTGVIHCAGLKQPGESTQKPLEYYFTNVEGTRALLEWCASQHVENFIFSSSCSVYGSASQPSNEFDRLQPQSPYAHSKAQAEQIIRDYKFSAINSFNFVSLRYFNVVGTGGNGSYDNSLSNLVPALCFAAQYDQPFTINGLNYETKDGTCVRDYVDVRDVARAHVLVAEALEHGRPLPTIMNLGTAGGYSVQDVIHAFERVTQKKIRRIEGPRRAGDPDAVLADSTLAHEVIGWSPSITLEESLEKAWLKSLKVNMKSWLE